MGAGWLLVSFAKLFDPYSTVLTELEISLVHQDPLIAGSSMVRNTHNTHTKHTKCPHAHKVHTRYVHTHTR